MAFTAGSTTVVMGPAAQPPGRPHLRNILMRVVVSLATAVLVPAGVLWGVLVLFNFPTAAIATLAWMIGAMSWRWATRRPVSGLLLLTLAILAIRTALTLITGSAFVYFVQPVFTDLAIAAVFLGSLLSARPVVSRLAPDFFPMDAAASARPEVRVLFRRLTLMWGLVVLIKAGITFWLLESLSTVDFVLIKSGAITTLTLTAAVVTIVWAAVVARQAGLLHPRM